jgi:hypothetical protein
VRSKQIYNILCIIHREWTRINAYNYCMNHSVKNPCAQYRLSISMGRTLRNVLRGLIFSLLLTVGFSADKKIVNDEKGRFGIYVDGKEIGEERYSIQGSSDSFQSESEVAFKNSGAKSQEVKIETQLTMDENYMPQSYRVKSSVGGRNKEIEATFVPGQATFKYPANGILHQSGLLLDDYYVLLDANVFHHFIFVGRLIEFDNSDSIQSLDVVIPQELDNGVLEIRDAGLDKIALHGKKKELHHLKVETGKQKFDLWVDDSRLLHKIAFPMKNIEVIRK